MFTYVPKLALTDEELDACSATSQDFYRRNRAVFMREYNAGVKKERTRILGIIGMQKSLGPEFASLADAMLADGRYSAEDLAKISYTKISARMGNGQAKAKLAETESAAAAEWEKSPVVRATFHGIKADYLAFRAYAAANKVGAR
jgi:hypothetical protein